MIRAVLSIGANLGDARAALRMVRDAFAADLVAASDVYRTPPWGGVEQGDFLNAVLIVDVDLTPLELLRAGQELENAAERVREVRWGPRTLDVDVVQVRELSDDGSPGPEIVSGEEVLTLPHSWAHERAFVLVPWLDADPEARLGDRDVAGLVGKLSASDVADVRKDPAGWGP